MPEYRRSESGPDHAKTFTAAVRWPASRSATAPAAARRRPSRRPPRRPGRALRQPLDPADAGRVRRADDPPTVGRRSDRRCPNCPRSRPSAAGWTDGSVGPDHRRRSRSLHPRAIRRHVAGADDFAARLPGPAIAAVRRRGKYLWLPLDDGDACIGHLGMSGQLLVLARRTRPTSPHLRVRFRFADGGPELRFVDQRTFGGLPLDELVPTAADAVPRRRSRTSPATRWTPQFDDAAFVDRAAPAPDRRQAGAAGPDA